MNSELLNAIDAHKTEFGVDVTLADSESVARYYSFLLEKNPVLHLVAPCSAEEFAVRHILESLFISKMIPKGSVIADIGSGGGLPGIPLAICREDLKVILIESKAKKSAFLEEAVSVCGISGRVRVVGRQFAETSIPKGAVVTARALDKFTKVLPKFLKWASGHRLILLGGPSLEEALAGSGVSFKKTLIPSSEQRYVFEISPTRKSAR